MSNLSVNTITDASGGSTASINGLTPQASNMQPHNLIINGAMTVAQRGTSVAGLNNTNGFYTCDRVKFYTQNGGPTYTVTQDTSAPTGFANSFKVQCTTADTSLTADHYTAIRMGLIERSDMVQASFGTSSAKSLTYSFWVKSNKTGDQLAMFTDFENQKEIGQVFTISTADTWEKKVITVVGNTGSSFTNSSDLGLAIDFYLAVGTNRSGGSTPTSWSDRVTANAGSTNLNIADSTANYFQITGVQLEVGSSGSSFAHEDYGTTLQKCQRYYQDAYFRFRSDNSSAYPITGTYRSVNFGTTMRDAPTMDTSDVSTGSSVTLDNVTGYKQGFHFRGTASSGYNYWVYGSFHAEAEL